MPSYAATVLSGTVASVVAGGGDEELTASKHALSWQVAEARAEADAEADAEAGQCRS